MNLYPAIKAKMGTWNYFMVKLTMRELADNVKFAADVYDDRTLDEAIQRVLNEGRVKKEIVSYLVRQDGRFFSSVVVAAIGGSPTWYPVEIGTDERFVLFRENVRLNNTFGILSFDGSQSYYALDGQHRLSAIKALLDPQSDVARDAPEGFDKEEISVLVVVPSDAESKEDFLIRYRRLFGNLNRYAKSMDKHTNIIMDEDDVFAILTRRLITDHPFFSASGRQLDSPKIKTQKGKNLKRGDSYFTSLETFYSMNIELLLSKERRNDEWSNLTRFMRFRPEEGEIDALDAELNVYWDALLAVLPELDTEPTGQRHHGADVEGAEGESDSALFWPITQELLAGMARDMLDFHGTSSPPTVEECTSILSPLGSIDWRLHELPWRHLILVPDGRGSWKMRSEDRKPAIAVVRGILLWQLGRDELDEEDVADLRSRWKALVLPALTPPEEALAWKNIESGVS